MLPAPLSEQAEPNQRSTLAGVLLCAAATIACLTPFVHKAFHIDDPLFLYAARQISAHPADPFGFRVNWEGEELPMAEVTQNGPLTSYYIALVAGGFGWSEVAMHLAFLVPAVAAVLGTYFLAIGFCRRPLLAALATLLCPVFLVSSTTVMSDTLMLAFWVWAMVLWLWSMDQGSHALALGSACLVAAAGVAKYFAVALIPLLLVYSLQRWPRIRWRVLYLAIPVALLTAYDGVMRARYGHSLLFGAASYAVAISSQWNSLSRCLITLSFSGGCLLSVLWFAPLLWSWRVWIVGLVGTALIFWLLFTAQTLGAAKLRSDSAALFLAAQLALFMVAGMSVLALALADLWGSRTAESCLLFLWIVGTFVFCWLFNWTINGRSILPMTPAVCILIVRRLDGFRRESVERGGPWQYVPLIPAGLLSLAVGWADACLAGTARSAATEIARRYGEQPDRVWFLGHWGFQYYMESYGFHPVDERQNRLAPGDILVVPGGENDLPAVAGATLVTIAQFRLMPLPLLATMQDAVGAGFYANVWGPLPFALGLVQQEQYLVMKVVPAAGLQRRVGDAGYETAQQPDSAEHGRVLE
jgi:hypothetical protein